MKKAPLIIVSIFVIIIGIFVIYKGDIHTVKKTNNNISGLPIKSNQTKLASTTVSNTSMNLPKKSTENVPKTSVFNGPATSTIYTIYGQATGIEGTIVVNQQAEVQYKINVEKTDSPMIKVGSQIIMSDFGCPYLGTGHFPNPYEFEGVTYNSQYGWYNCKTATSLIYYDN